MKSLKNKYIMYLIILNGVLCTLLIGWGMVNYVVDMRFIIGLEIAALFFFIYEFLVIQFTDTKTKTITARQSVNLFLGFKTGKIILSIILITIYAITVKVELKQFIIAFVLLYLIYLLFDTIYLVSREKDDKKKKYKYKLNEIEKVSNYYK